LKCGTGEEVRKTGRKAEAEEAQNSSVRIDSEPVFGGIPYGIAEPFEDVRASID
jgi:hypothetical protein